MLGSSSLFCCRTNVDGFSVRLPQAFGRRCAEPILGARRDLGKPCLDLIQPRRICRSEVKMHVWMRRLRGGERSRQKTKLRHYQLFQAMRLISSRTPMDRRCRSSTGDPPDQDRNRRVRRRHLLIAAEQPSHRQQRRDHDGLSRRERRRRRSAS